MAFISLSYLRLPYENRTCIARNRWLRNYSAGGIKNDFAQNSRRSRVSLCHCNFNVDKVFRLFFVMYLFSVAIFCCCCFPLTVWCQFCAEPRGFGCFVFRWLAKCWWIWDGAIYLIRIRYGCLGPFNTDYKPVSHFDARHKARKPSMTILEQWKIGYLKPNCVYHKILVGNANAKDVHTLLCVYRVCEQQTQTQQWR